MNAILKGVGILLLGEWNRAMLVTNSSDSEF